MMRWSVLLVAAGFLVPQERALAQGATKWVAVGSLQNWFSEVGCEIEEGLVLSQQYGLRWPAQYNYQDCQAAKGFWIGATNWNDGTRVWTNKVVHVGPRVTGTGEGDFWPMEFKLIPKFDRPKVYVDGLPTFQIVEEAETADPALKADRVLYTRANTAIGLMEERYVYAFSQQYHDNYHVYEFVFTNTGNADNDAEIEYPTQTLTGLYFYWQYRYSVCREIRYCVDNSAGWGINTMNDARGFPPDIANTAIPASENDVRAQFAWHGFHNLAKKPAAGTYPNAATYDNIGAPIWNPSASSGFVDNADTNWRLGAAQFMGTVSIYAPASAQDATNDLTQPSTTNYVASDEDITRNNSQFNTGKMAAEYTRMSQGHVTRHAWQVDPTGNFSQQTVMANIGDGSPGGWSTATGYGPYTLGPGESVKIVYAEGINGLSREECVRLGLKYKEGTISTVQKNDSVLSGRLRLLETFRRAEANYSSGFNIPQPPYPPAEFNVNGLGNKIALSWSPNPNETANNFVGYRVYRAESRADSNYHLIYQCGGTAPTNPEVVYSASITYAFDDVTAIRGRDYFYHVVSFTNPLPADAATLTPAGELESGMFYTQTYDPANLKRAAGVSPDAIRIVPNPYIISGTNGVSRFSNEVPDRIAFFDIPGDCSIKIYTELGELIYEIDHTNGTGDDYWNSVTSSNQVVVSGIYLVAITARSDQVDAVTGEVQFKSGQTIIKKLVIIR